MLRDPYVGAFEGRTLASSQPLVPFQNMSHQGPAAFLVFSERFVSFPRPHPRPHPPREVAQRLHSSPVRSPP